MHDELVAHPDLRAGDGIRTRHLNRQAESRREGRTGEQVRCKGGVPAIY